MDLIIKNAKLVNKPNEYQIGIENGKISARNRDLRALGFKTFCGIRMQAILPRGIETCRDCN